MLDRMAEAAMVKVVVAGSIELPQMAKLASAVERGA